MLYKKVNIGSGLNEVEVCLWTGRSFAGAVFYVNHKVQFFEIRQNILYDWEKFKAENALLNSQVGFPGYFGLNIFSVQGSVGKLLKAAESRTDVS